MAGVGVKAMCGLMAEALQGLVEGTPEYTKVVELWMLALKVDRTTPGEPLPDIVKRLRQAGDHGRRYFREKAARLREEIMEDVLFTQLKARELTPEQQGALADLIQTTHDEWVEDGKTESQKAGSKRTGGSGAAAAGPAGATTAESPDKTIAKKTKK